MKSFLAILGIFITSIIACHAQQGVAINTDGSAPNPKAILDVKSTTKGLLIPRMTTAQRSGIADPPEGLMIFDVDLHQVMVVDTVGAGFSWRDMTGTISLPYYQAGEFPNSAFHIQNAFNDSTHIAGEFAGGYGLGLYGHGQTGGKFFGTKYGIYSTGDPAAFLYSGTTGLQIEMLSDGKALIAENGRTGLGTLNPQAKLHVFKNGMHGSDPLIKISRQESAGYPEIGLKFQVDQQYAGQPAVAVGNLGMMSDNRLNIFTNDDMDNPAVSIYNNKVGINKTDGTYPLSVNGTTAIYEAGQYMGQIAGNVTTGNLYIGAKSETTASGLFAKNLLLQTSTDFQQKMGYVGINTLIPAAFLEVNKDGYSSGAVAKFGNSKFDSSYNNYTFIRGGISKGNGELRLNDLNAADVFIANGGGNVIFPHDSTKVRIGTTTGNYPLNVKGIIRSEELIIETNWADYVFNHDYPLRSLEEVEAFIQEHKHLPGVQSATEIQTNGLKVAASSTKMMEKIEELTLYIIEQNKKLKTLEAAIEMLKNNQKK